MKIAVFAHFDKYHTIKPYVIYYLEQLNTVCDNVIFVTTSNLAEQECAKLANLCDKVIMRENVGHDFYSYKVGIEAIEDISIIEQLILCNDSCFGPLFPFIDIFVCQDAYKSDVWGMSFNHRPRIHLQSFFLVFNNNVVQSDIFKNFWNNLAIINDKDKIVNDYEVGLSQQLMSAGFQLNSVLPDSEYSINCFKLIWRKFMIVGREYFNLNSRYCWKNLFEPLGRIDKTISLFDYSIKKYQFPLLKKSLFADTWVSKQDIYDVIRLNTNYDINLIKDIVDE